MTITHRPVFSVTLLSMADVPLLPGSRPSRLETISRKPHTLTADWLGLSRRPFYIASSRTAQKTPLPTFPPLLLADSLPSDGSGIIACLHSRCPAMAVFWLRYSSCQISCHNIYIRTYIVKIPKSNQFPCEPYVVHELGLGHPCVLRPKDWSLRPWRSSNQHRFAVVTGEKVSRVTRGRRREQASRRNENILQHPPPSQQHDSGASVQQRLVICLCSYSYDCPGLKQVQRRIGSNPALRQFVLVLTVWDLRFSQRWLWRVLSSGIWRHVVRWKSTGDSEKHFSNFTFEE
jgi:hypothetical protein